MKYHPKVRSLLLSLALTVGTAAFAQVSFNLVVAPPAPQFEVVPAQPPGYVWAPGYWAWNLDRHIWVRGRPMLLRTGYRWEPDRWEQHNGNYVRQPGRWVRDLSDRSAQARYMPQPGKDASQRQKNKKGRRGQDERHDPRHKGH